MTTEGESLEKTLSPRRGGVDEQLKQSGFRIPTRVDEQRFVHGTHGETSWQARVLAFLHQKWVQHSLLALLVLDVLILFTELFLSALYPICDLVVRDAISCCPPPEDVRWLASDEPLCEVPLVDTDYEAACDDHKWHTVHAIEEVFFILTFIILSTFMLELTLYMAALGSSFFHHFFYVLDLIVVSLGLAFEIVFHVVHRDDLAAYTGLIVISRCWRFVRIGHGLMEVTAELVTERYEKVVQLAEELEKALEEHERKTGHDTSAINGNGESASGYESESLREIQRKNKALIEAIQKASPDE